MLVHALVQSRIASPGGHVQHQHVARLGALRVQFQFLSERGHEIVRIVDQDQPSAAAEQGQRGQFVVDVPPLGGRPVEAVRGRSLIAQHTLPQTAQRQSLQERFVPEHNGNARRLKLLLGVQIIEDVDGF